MLDSLRSDDLSNPPGRRAAPRRFSRLLQAMADDATRERISVEDLLLAMEDRAFGALMLVFALPNALPMPPGTSGLLGLPLVYLAAQLMLGQRPWLPRFIGGRSVSRTDFAAFMERAGPWLRRAERLLRPRLPLLAGATAEHAIGAICLLLAIILLLPVPLGNMLPALSISVFSFGILGRDGVWTIFGVILAAISLIVAGGVVFALVQGAVFLLTRQF
ncbi:exopolysaccharide biosynthesis protein [Chelativorans sp. AA-79]|uniref:exopolysaccharide biosynthesis protein n=1 Tax=Chelativorans sp. AA-79 TaxID=3028735 RepID=UPI0023F9211B|nr:exopolysaccharide biosynthesis protein [Chelativorans sp. AA-79]WEX07346.1 exopolysaccharide biosynthesis protein [Chelativorans sp. AA-79]